MDEVFGLLKLGVNVDIQRSDGRIHSAVISGVNNDAKTVTVEWFERGETKGKEIEIELIFNLNPNLAPSEPQSVIPSKLSRSDPQLRRGDTTSRSEASAAGPSSSRLRQRVTSSTSTSSRASRAANHTRAVRYRQTLTRALSNNQTRAVRYRQTLTRAITVPAANHT
ncbi:Kinesin-like protein KIF2A [Amphibalanus amphitrite]|uniref:Kinesin-like protein KIF2A n=1 Tax=Amphibalanus amphitrite TaxID=1232801 RepID=A0A6A4VGD1_AMPAM|nr:Kinesin-like protein KIF2A [Amphibalanus amphitrite]